MAQRVESVKLPKVNLSKTSIGKVNLPGSTKKASKMSPLKKDIMLKLANKNAADLKAESDKLNGAWNLTKATVAGIPRSMVSIAGQAARHPIRTAGHIGTGIYNEGIRPILNLPSYLGAPRAPKINFKPANSTEEGIQQGFGVGGMAGSFMAGNAVLRPLMESPKVVSAVGRVMPKAVSTIGASTKMKPLAQGMLSDQIITQALMDKDSSLKDRAINAAITPVASLGFHAAGRGAGLAASRVRDAIGKRLPAGIKDSDLSNVDLSKASDDDIIEYWTKTKNVDAPIYHPKTGAIDTDAMNKRAAQMSKLEERVRGVVENKSNFLKKYYTSQRAVFQKSGEHGKEFSRRLDEMNIQEPQTRALLLQPFHTPGVRRVMDAKDQRAWNRVVNAQIDPKQRIHLRSTDEAETFKAVNDLMHHAHKKAVEKGFKITMPDGTTRPYDPDPATADKHWPGYFEKKIAEDEMHMKYEVDGLIESGMSRVQAEIQVASDLSKRIKQGTIGVLERPRLNNDPRIRKDPGVITDYIDDFAKLDTRVDLIGQSNEKILPLVEGMTKSGVPMKDILAVLDEKFGSQKEANEAIKWLLKYNQFTKLPLSFFSNLTQVANTATVSGWGNTFKALWRFAKSSEDRQFMKDFTRIAGGLDDLNITSEAGVTHGKLMNAALYPFKKVEEFNRIIAADASRLYLKELIAMVKKNPSDGAALRGLSGLGIDAAKLSRNKFRIDESEFARAANNFIGNTQFHINAMNLPLWSRSPLGKLFTQFKSFGFMQTKFYRDFVYNEAKNGNYKPLMRAVAAVPPLYFAAKYGRDLATFRDPDLRASLGLSVKEKKEKEEDMDTFNALMSMTGTLPAQLIQSANFTAENTYGEGGKYRSLIGKSAIVAGNIFGPTVSDAGNLLGALEQSGDIMKSNRLSGNEAPEDQLDTTFPLKRYALGWVPFIGQGLKNVYFKDWPQRAREEYRDNAKEGFRAYFETKDKNILNELNSSAKTIEQQNVLKDVAAEIAREQMKPEDKEMYENIQARKKAINKLPLLNQ